MRSETSGRRSRSGGIEVAEMLTSSEHEERQRDEAHTVLRCGCCTCGGALPAMLRPDHGQVAKIVSGAILREPLCNFCWAWTKKVAMDAKMRCVLGKVD